MPLALLLSPDDQAVSAITGVLEEMSVTCERPLDGISAAQKLNSHSFDLVLVDCENLPAAKLIFDVCRRGKDGHNPVPIAIVDGRAGLPTAFRLGAELILTKPVAKDQARTTIRTAVGRVKPAHTPAIESPADAVLAAHVSAVPVNTNSSLDSKILSYDEMAAEPAIQPVLETRAAAASAAAVPAPSAAAAHGISAAPAKDAMPTKQSPAAMLQNETVSTKALAEAELKPVAEEKLSDDPVLAELDKPDAQPPAPAPVFSAYAQETVKQERSRSRAPLIFVLVLVLIGGGAYAAWMYVPGFRVIAQPQVDRALALVGMSHPQAPAATTVPAIKATQAAAVATASASLDDPAKASQPATEAASANASMAAPANASMAAPANASTLPPSSAPPAPANSAVVVAPAPSGASASTPVVTPTVPNKAGTANAQTTITINSKLTGANKAGAEEDESDADLPGAKTAVILSSKGAEKRLIHSVPPVYPAEARSAGVEGTVVLKTVVDDKGKVMGAKAVEGDEVLASAAIKAVKQWRYRPYLRDGKPMPFQTIVLVDFQRP